MKNEQTGTGLAAVGESTLERSGRPSTGLSGDGLERGGASEAAEHQPPQQQAEEQAKHSTERGILREYFESLLVTAVMALFGMTFILQAVKVPTGSMQNTILIGDHLLVNKFIFAPGETLPFLPQREIRRGDIVVFKYPGNPHDPERDRTDPTSKPFETNFVKRVVGLPGDRVELRGDRVIINGRELAERRLTAVNPPDDDPRTPDVREDGSPLNIEDEPPPTGEGSYSVYYNRFTRQDTLRGIRRPASPDFHYGVEGQAAVVPADKYFVMGDNRENSLDSRAWGFVARDLIVGRAMFVYWSYDYSAPSTGNLLLDFFQNSRWERTGTLVR
ncbi:MAG TPA: signal peptidase I [Pyrinomonadaceae bacterium]|jgi:signal peptidase I